MMGLVPGAGIHKRREGATSLLSLQGGYGDLNCGLAVVFDQQMLGAPCWEREPLSFTTRSRALEKCEMSMVVSPASSTGRHQAGVQWPFFIFISKRNDSSSSQVLSHLILIATPQRRHCCDSILQNRTLRHSEEEYLA